MPIHKEITPELLASLESKRWRHNIDPASITMKLVTKPDPRNNLDHGRGSQQREHYPDITAPEYHGTCSQCGEHTLIEKSGTYKRAARDAGTQREEVDIFRCPAHVQNVRDLNAMRRAGWTIPALRKGRVSDSEKHKPLFRLEEVVPPIEFGVPATEDTDPDALTQLDVIEEHILDKEQDGVTACEVCHEPSKQLHLLIDTHDGFVSDELLCPVCFRIEHLIRRRRAAWTTQLHPIFELTHAFSEAVQPSSKSEREALSRIVGKPRFYKTTQLDNEEE